jgi:hypothetical protein
MSIHGRIEFCGNQDAYYCSELNLNNTHSFKNKGVSAYFTNKGVSYPKAH